MQKSRPVLFWGTVTVVAVGMMAGIFWALSQTQRAELETAESRIRPLRAVCEQGVGVPEARSYDGDAEPNLLAAFLTTDGVNFEHRSADYPRRWQAGNVTAAELVVCLHAGAETVETCPAPAVANRVQYYVEVTLLNAYSGDQVAATLLKGFAPPACSETASGELTGSPVNPAEVEKWLLTYVEP